MASHHAPQHQRYSVLPPPPNNDLRLPSLKSLNFTYRNPHQEPPPPPHSTNSTLEPHVLSSQDRHTQSWGRPSQSSSLALPSSQPQHHHQQQLYQSHQQHTPPLSAGHEPPKTTYSPKHDLVPHVNSMPAQATPVLGTSSLNQTSRGEEPASSKRSRTTSQTLNNARDARPIHTPYPQQYSPYTSSQAQPPPSPFHSVSQAAPANNSSHTPQASHQPHPSSHASQQSHPAHPPPTPPSPFPHEHAHHPAPTPVSSHPSYNHYHQQQYAPHRSSMHPPPQPQPVHPGNQSHGNPYPSPGPPSAPPPQGPWESSNTATAPSHHSQQQQAPPPPPQQPQAHIAPPSTPQHAPQTVHHLQQHQASPASSHVPMQQDTPQMHHQSVPTPVQHHARPPLHSYHQPPQQQSQAPPTPAPPPAAFSRTTTLIPTQLETRPSYQPPEPERTPRDGNLAEITRLCHTLHNFAARFSNTSITQPNSNELAEMTRTAHHVVRLVDDYRRLHVPESERNKMDTTDDHRPPKRPWEDIAHAGPSAEGTSFQEQYSVVDKSTAEKDMEIIRQKRASSTAGGSGTAGQPKSKYRKRSRATPPGKCHSCNIRETPEWRRGPDGARTLCNACGLHYAKLMRKRDRNANGELPKIDLETLRASARAADNKSQLRQHQQTVIHHSQDAAAPAMDPKHGSQHNFVVTMAPDAPPPPPPSENRLHPPPPPPHHAMASNSSSLSIPPPPPPSSHWNSAPPPRAYPVHEPIQHQSFMRSSQHPSAAQASPR